MRKFILWSIICAALIVTPIGCDEQQLQQGDRIASNVQAGADLVMGTMESPAGAVIPADWKLYGLLAYGLISSATNAWQTWRTKTVKSKLSITDKTLTAVVKGIENAEDKASNNPTNPIKSSIQNQMVEARIFDQADRLVDRIKLNI